MYPLAVSEGVVFVWMGDDPWGEKAKDILPVPSTVDKLDENKVSRWARERAKHIQYGLLFILGTCYMLCRYYM